MHVFTRSLLALASSLFVANAQASNCSGLADLLGLCDVARQAGRDGAREIAQGVTNAADIAYSAVNFWPWLIQKYHTGTADEKKRARELVSKVFGADTLEDAKPFEISLQFEGVDTAKSKLDFVLLRDYVKPDLKAKVLNANTADFNILPLVGSSPQSKDVYQEYLADVASVRARVADAVSKFVVSPGSTFRGVPIRTIRTTDKFGCTDISDNGGLATITHPRTHDALTSGPGYTQTCRDIAAWQEANRAAKQLSEAIMLTVDPKVDKRANRLLTTFAYEGYKFLTLVFPKEQLESQPNLKVSLRIHMKDNPGKPIPIFATSPWTVSQRTIAVPNAVFDSGRREHSGKYYAYMIDLGL